MNFEEVLPALRAGHKIRRTAWTPGYFLYLSDAGRMLSAHTGMSAQWVEHLSTENILRNDWEVH